MLDREESVVETLPTSIAPSPMAPIAPRAPIAPTAEDRASDGTDGASMVEEALDEWRTLDLEEQESASESTISESTIEELPPPESRARPEFEFASEVLTAVRDLAEPEPELPARARARGSSPEPSTASIPRRVSCCRRGASRRSRRSRKRMPSSPLNRSARLRPSVAPRVPARPRRSRTRARRRAT
jgi:hypothetical protein